MDIIQKKRSEYKPVHILVVDDNVILLRTVKEMLSEKYSVAIAASANQAFDSISARLPDVILLDYEMPFVDGEELFLSFKKRNDTCLTPVIFFTGSADREVVTKLLALKPAGYILKPPNKQKLIDAIEKTLNNHFKI